MGFEVVGEAVGCWEGDELQLIAGGLTIIGLAVGCEESDKVRLIAGGLTSSGNWIGGCGGIGGSNTTGGCKIDDGAGA